MSWACASTVTMFVVSAGLVGWWRMGLSQPDAPTVAVPSDVEAGQIFQRLHRGIYRALEARSEREIYDVLAGSLEEGEMLEKVYFEIYAALDRRYRGNNAFAVRRIKPLSTDVLPADDVPEPAFRVRYRWLAYGTVTHRGHTHARFNEYDVLYLVKHNGRAWRIADSQVQQHVRVGLGRRGTPLRD
jgi:hypothetical protein